MGSADGRVNRLPSTLPPCIPTSGPGHHCGAHRPPLLPPAAGTGGAEMLFAAPEGETETEHPWVSALSGARGYFFARAGHGKTQTRRLSSSPSGEEVCCTRLVAFLTSCQLRSLLAACFPMGCTFLSTGDWIATVGANGRDLRPWEGAFYGHSQIQPRSSGEMSSNGPTHQRSQCYGDEFVPNKDMTAVTLGKILLQCVWEADACTEGKAFRGAGEVGPGHVAKSLIFRLQSNRQESQLLARGADNHTFSGVQISSSDRQKGRLSPGASRTPTRASPGLQNALHACSATEAEGGMRLPRSVPSSSAARPRA